jgi:hypothetical protein
MKKFQKIGGYLLAILITFLVSPSSVFAEGKMIKDDSSLVAFQVIGGLVMLLFFVVGPFMKSAGKHITVDKK